MRGHIKVRRWLPFRARQVLNPHRGFVWSARAAGVIAGSDRYVDDAGVMDWKLAGLVRVVHAEGPDISRSAAGRAGAEAVCLPTALLPRFGVRWSATGDDQVTARYQVGETPLEVSYRLDPDGRIRSMVFDRWGDPDSSGSFSTVTPRCWSCWIVVGIGRIRPSAPVPTTRCEGSSSRTSARSSRTSAGPSWRHQFRTTRSGRR